MDNARFHRMGKLELLCEEFGHKLLPLPPYSPEYNPIEKTWAHIKKHLKKVLPSCNTFWLSVNCSGLNKKLTSGEDNRCPLHFYIQSDENSFLKVVKVPKTKSISFDEFNEIIGCFQFGVGIR